MLRYDETDIQNSQYLMQYNQFGGQVDTSYLGGQVKLHFYNHDQLLMHYVCRVYSTYICYFKINKSDLRLINVAYLAGYRTS